MSSPRDAAGLAAFRVFIGVLGTISALRFLHYGWVDALFVTPRFHFKYWFAPFVEPLSRTGMVTVFWIIAASGLLIALGLCYRLAIVTFLLAFSYVQLIDVTNYLNHYYLLSLLALLMTCMPLGQVYGLDGWLSARQNGLRPRTTLPGWCVAILRLQIAVVYTYAGVAKLTGDWLVHAQPLSIWLSARTSLPLVGPLLAEPWAPLAMSWLGCAFDLTIVCWLSWRKTRPWAFAALVMFHALTRHLFPIGMFPFIMVASASVLFEPGWPRRWLPLPAATAWAKRPTSGPRLALGGAALALFALVQVLAPLRTFAYGGDVHWHEQGMRFSWRVMVREKNASVTYLVDDLRSGRTVEVSPRAYLDARQEREFATQPDLIAQLARHIARERSGKTGSPVRVRAEVLANLNGRRATLLLDPNVDLANTHESIAPAPWILPIPEGQPSLLRASR